MVRKLTAILEIDRVVPAFGIVNLTCSIAPNRVSNQSWIFNQFSGEPDLEWLTSYQSLNQNGIGDPARLRITGSPKIFKDQCFLAVAVAHLRLTSVSPRSSSSLK